MVFQFLISKTVYALLLVAHLNLFRLRIPETAIYHATLGEDVIYEYSSSGTSSLNEAKSSGTADLHTIISDSYAYTCFPTIDPDIASLNFKSYLHLSRSSTFFNRSCSIFDRSDGAIWLFGDAIGAFPIFYSFSQNNNNNNNDNINDNNDNNNNKNNNNNNNNDNYDDDNNNNDSSDNGYDKNPVIEGGRYIVTSDYVLALRLGYYDINSVGPGGIIVFSSQTGEVKQVLDRRAIIDSVNADLYGSYGILGRRKPSSGFNSMKHASYRLIASLTGSILGNEKYKDLTMSQRYSTNVTIEIDPMDPSSSIVDCIIANMGFSRQIVLTSPTSSFYGKGLESFPLVFLQDTNTADENGSMVSLLEDRAHTQVRRPTLRSVALERWKICLLASESNSSLLHYDTGVFDRSIKNYFQNLFCDFLNVKIDYIFNSELLVRTIDQLEYPRSNLMSVLQLLYAESICNTSNNNQLVRKEVISVDVNGQLTQPLSDSGHKFINAENSQPCSLFKLLAVGTQFQSSDRYLFVVLVTSDYMDIFLNFICSTSQPHVNATNILVITPHDAVAKVAQAFNIGYFKYDVQDGDSNTGASFGSLSYQELMLIRTRIVMDLLYLGFNAIIADIDTVWNNNPLEILRDVDLGVGRNDIAVTNDFGEICGCFVVLTNSKRSVHFWQKILDNHIEIIEDAKKNNGELVKFSDSEQKLLTAFLTEGKYKDEIHVKMLSQALFPSGYEYFNLKNASAGPTFLPTIIHNNFIVSKSAKIYRFQKHLLWKVVDGWEATFHHKISKEVCLVGSVAKASIWDACTIKAVFNTSIPALQCILPLHGDSLVGYSKLVSVMTENSHKEYSTGMLWADSMSGINFYKMMILDLKFNNDNLVMGFTISLDNSNVECSADIGVNRTVFAFDRNGNYEFEAIAQARVSKYLFKHLNNLRPQVDFKLQSFMSPYPLIVSSSEGVIFYIKVLAYKRVESLLRLLLSLKSAEYMNHTVHLEICVDGPKDESDINEVSNVQEVVRLSKDFEWPFGEKSISLQAINRGLKNQWLSVWEPRRDNEVAFIFEDDMEVTPLYFLWAYRAVMKYYVDDEGQRFMHRRILEAVRHDIRLNLLFRNDSRSKLDEILGDFSGEPIIYGICLQKQHLDPLHYPKRLDIRNGNKPYLFSLVGSWGPLMLPMMWQAFREWWMWQVKSSSEDPLLENTIINYFYANNKDIWTPWFARFSHSIGAKCFYSNLPGNFSFVVNYRESGENYAVSAGKVNELIPPEYIEFVRDLLPSILPSDALGFSFDKLYEAVMLSVPSAGKGVGSIDVRVLEKLEFMFSICSFPSAFELALSQYDFAVRRVGSFFIRSTLYNPYDIEKFSTFTDEKILVDWKNMIEYIRESSELSKADAVFGLGKEFWIGAADIIEKVVPYFTVIVHADVTPLLPLLLLKFDVHYALMKEEGGGGGGEDEEELSSRSDEYAISSCLSSYKFNAIDKHKLIWQYMNRSITNEVLQCKKIDDLIATSNSRLSLMIIEAQSLKPGLTIPFAHNLAFIGPCATSPTSFSLKISNRGSNGFSVLEFGNGLQDSSSSSGSSSSSSSSSSSRVDFYRIESLCLEVSNGWGLTVYRAGTVLTQDWIENRHSISRRLVNSLVSERFVQLRQQVTFV